MPGHASTAPIGTVWRSRTTNSPAPSRLAKAPRTTLAAIRAAAITR